MTVSDLLRIVDEQAFDRVYIINYFGGYSLFYMDCKSVLQSEYANMYITKISVDYNDKALEITV